jgi:Uncharacterized alpha/beta hydrolase domain (DUF2235)
MNKSSCIRVFLSMVQALSGCALVSGNTSIPIAMSDREAVSNVEKRLQFNIPLITQSINGRTIRVFKIAFDGTNNDRARVSSGERQTIVADIADMVDAKYFPGPGMQNPNFVNYLDSLFGFTSNQISADAEREFFKQASVWLKEDSNVEIRVFVTGFSRGAAIARNFMNRIDQNWYDNFSQKSHQDSRPHFYALLFDTVSTGQLENLNLAIPKSLDFLIHMVAKDEPRLLFAPVVDVDEKIPTEIVGLVSSANEDTKNINRINTFLLPGAHSDIGSAYKSGVGERYREISERILYYLGLSKKNCWSTTNDPFIDGKHDSRGVLDRMSGVSISNSENSSERIIHAIRIPIAPLGLEREVEIFNKLVVLTSGKDIPNSFSSSTRTVRSELSVNIKRNGEGIEVLPFYPADAHVKLGRFKFWIEGGIRHLDYEWITPHGVALTKIILDEVLWAHLPDGKTSVFTHGIFSEDEKDYLVYQINGLRLKKMEANKSAISESNVLPKRLGFGCNS